MGDAQADDRWVVLGKIGSTFGVQGWVRITSYTDPPENILDYDRWHLHRAGQWEAVEVEGGRMTAKGVLAKLVGIETPEEARLQVGIEIAVLRSELPPTAPGEFYWSDLEGLEAVTPSGESLGRLDHFRSTPGGDIAVVKGAREHWIPFVKDRIVKVDLDAGRIVFDWGVDWLDD
ncbi:ribosome maturation factor RimM [Steroidobacter agaridevorans]|uniref:Ribosome maturation factor RimM n=1 Tax=Steroidobacter agaridevorans TaxID=2695856 RepID=A0A829YNQ3_9GAMM|nr:ribosome maturation factor RimM [Steroidobacter agaridevorans]GFE84462.1 ribosome maturation factor RimM [Steroidobacter agaridevorans]